METLVKPSTLFWNNLDYIVQNKNVNYLYVAEKSYISKGRLKRLRDEQVLPTTNEIDSIAKTLNIDYYVLFEDHLDERREDDILPRETELTISEIFWDNLSRFNHFTAKNGMKHSLTELCRKSGVQYKKLSGCKTQNRLPKENIIIAFTNTLGIAYMDLFDDWSDIS